MDFGMSSNGGHGFRVSDFFMEAFAFVFIFAHSTMTSLFGTLLAISECVHRGGYDLPGDVANSTNDSAQLLNECVDSSMNVNTTGTEGAVHLRDLVFTLPLVELMCSLVVCVMVGGWSDAHGRRLHFVAAVAGALMKDVSALVFVLNGLPGRGVFYGVTVVSGLFGGINLFTAGALCHVSDNSDYRSRTLRIGSLTFALYLGHSLSVFAERIWKPLVAPDSFVRVAVSVAGAQLVLHMVCLLGVAAVVRESLHVISCYNGSPLWNLVRQLKNVATLATRRRPNNARRFVLLLYAVFLLARFGYCGEKEVWAEYLFRRFSWTHQAPIMLGLQFLCEALVTMFAVCMARRMLFKDTTLAIAGAVSFMVASAIKAAALSGGTHGLAVLVGSLSPVITIAVLSLLSKLVHPEEFGSLFANIAVLSIVAPLLASVSYWELFEVTKTMVAELIYLLSITAGSLLCLLLVYVRRNLHFGSLGNLIMEEKLPLLRARHQDSGAAIL